jgi:Chromosome segregation ATPases
MTQIEQVKCFFCGLSTPVANLPGRTLGDPADLAVIEVRDCRGRKGLPVVQTMMLLDCIEQYPEVFDKLKDISLGMVSSLYDHKLIEAKDLPNYLEVDDMETKIQDLTEKLETATEQLANAETEAQKLAESSESNNAQESETIIQDLNEQIETLQEQLNTLNEQAYDMVSLNKYNQLKHNYIILYNKFREFLARKRIKNKLPSTNEAMQQISDDTETQETEAVEEQNQIEEAEERARPEPEEEYDDEEEYDEQAEEDEIMEQVDAEEAEK